MTLSAGQTFGEAAAEVIAARTAAVFAARHDVLDTTDIEGVHRMRVATRRLRAALEVFRPCLDRRQGARALAEVKALADALGERRDRDVQLERLERLEAKCAGAERHAVELLADELRREQRRANRHLAKALAHSDREQLHKRLEKLAR